MITIKFDGLAQLQRTLDDVGRRQIPYVTMRTLNDLAFAAMRAGREEIKQRLDRPTRYTTTAFYVRKKATKQDLSISVGISDYLTDVVLSRGGPDRKLHHIFQGGHRSRKGLEMALQARGLISAAEQLVPGKGARVNAYGNVSPGQIQQIMAQLRLFNDKAQWSTQSERSRRNQQRAGRFFWSTGTGRSANFPRGIWVVRGSKQIAAAVFLVKSGVSYQRLIDLDAVGQRVVDANLQSIWAKHWDAAMRSAR